MSSATSMPTTRLRREFGNSIAIVDFGRLPPESRRETIKHGIKRVRLQRVNSDHKGQNIDGVVVTLGSKHYRVAEPAKRLLDDLVEGKAGRAQPDAEPFELGPFLRTTAETVLDQVKPIAEQAKTQMVPKIATQFETFFDQARNQVKPILEQVKPLVEQVKSMSPPQTRSLQEMMAKMSPRPSPPSTVIVKTITKKNEVIREVVIRTSPNGKSKVVRRRSFEDTPSDRSRAKSEYEELSDMDLNTSLPSEGEDSEDLLEQGKVYDDDLYKLESQQTVGRSATNSQSLFLHMLKSSERIRRLLLVEFIDDATRATLYLTCHEVRAMIDSFQTEIKQKQKNMREGSSQSNTSAITKTRAGSKRQSRASKVTTTDIVLVPPMEITPISNVIDVPVARTGD